MDFAVRFWVDFAVDLKVVFAAFDAVGARAIFAREVCNESLKGKPFCLLGEAPLSAW